MQKPLAVALVAAGQVSRANVARLLADSDQLGPIKTASFRVATRVSNTLRAGTPVKRYADLRFAKTVILAVPDADLPRISLELAECGVSWRGKVIALLSARLDSSDLEVLQQLGAHTGSLHELPLFGEPAFVVEGHSHAVRALRSLLTADRRSPPRVIEIRKGEKDLFNAALGFVSSMALPLIVAAVDCLRLAGLETREAQLTAVNALQQQVKSFLKAGRKAWTWDAAAGLWAQAAVLDSAKPELAQLVRALVDHSTGLLRGRASQRRDHTPRKIAAIALSPAERPARLPDSALNQPARK